ncbi:fungal-specific transcription factor domain-containing protein [Aspergillus keveii]|uniref:Fungal-specific transcription factor domain-containing protein n=1 Tax=Aspergillus keveii TaxID=714993 RepID=A0ABR4G422_9EURO
MTEPRIIRKRNRTALSCYDCRRRKVKCDRARPSCKECITFSLSCHYEPDPRRRPPPSVVVNREEQNRNEESHSTTAENPTPPIGIRGALFKSRVYGHGHWMNTHSLMEGLPSLQPVGDCFERLRENAKTEVTETLTECKRLARAIKKQRPSRKSLPADIHTSVPESQVLDELIMLYFTTFEPCYRILHYRSFMAEYETYTTHREDAESPIVLQLLLVMTIAGPMHTNGNVRRDIASNARAWIDLAQGWVSAPLEKDRLTLNGLQIYCLLLLSRQVNQIGADLVWISAGSLMRMAFQMGLQHDPDFLGEMSVEQKETRRRLWYTILEMDAQAALDSGAVSMFSTAISTTRPPNNEDSESFAGPHVSSPSFQSLLIKSLPLRLSITRVVNHMQDEASYNKVLELGNELASACRELVTAIARDGSPNSFSSTFCTHLVSRFLLCLHYRFSLKSVENPLYAHSRQACLEVALDLVSFLQDGLYSCVLRTGGGMFRDILTRGALIIFADLNTEPEAGISAFAKERNRARLQPLLEAARQIVNYARDRIWLGDMNVKIYVWLSMMNAQAQARLEGLPIEQAVSSAMHESLRAVKNMLKTLAPLETAAPDMTYRNSSIVPPGEPEIGIGSDFDSLDGLFDFDFDTRELSHWTGAAW